MEMSVDLHKTYKPQSESFIKGTANGGNKYVAKWWGQEQTKEKKTKGLKAAATVKATYSVK